ncbi:hypothetical protein [Mycobacterium sp. MMS18-G62]
MAIGVIWHPPVDKESYEAIRDKVWQGAQDKGMTFHASGEADGGWRIIELWDSREGLEQFIREDLARAFEQGGGVEGAPPQPDSVFEIYYQGP